MHWLIIGELVYSPVQFTFWTACVVHLLPGLVLVQDSWCFPNVCTELAHRLCSTSQLLTHCCVILSLPVGGVVCFHDSHVIHVCDNVLVGYAHWFILHLYGDHITVSTGPAGAFGHSQVILRHWNSISTQTLLTYAVSLNSAIIICAQYSLTHSPCIVVCVWVHWCWIRTGFYSSVMCCVLCTAMCILLIVHTTLT